tara:strand:+ start:7738 stop:9447 length:1710 start_codon:yes stop_codon:yes gene_type:complete
MLPDYPDRVIAEHRRRVEIAALAGTLLLVAAGAWWLLESVGSESDSLLRFGPVVLMFSAAVLLPDLVEFGPMERSRIATAGNVSWPPLLAFTAIQYGQDAELLPLAIMLVVVLALWRSSRLILGVTLESRRWRGLTSLAGLSIALPILSSTSNPVEWAIVVVPSLATMAPDLLTKDDLHDERKAFAVHLRESEVRLLELQSRNPGMQQPASLLKAAREEGWDDPERGMMMLAEAEHEAERILALSKDLGAIRDDVREAIERAERVSDVPEGPRRFYDLALREAEHGSLREAEQLLRTAKAKAINIEEHWSAASDAITEAEAAIGNESGHMVESVRAILGLAREAMANEEPEEALSMVSSIGAHMDSIGNVHEEATRAIDDAEHALAAVEGYIPVESIERLSVAKEAMEAGDAALAKGLANSISREIRQISDAMKEVQRALRHRKQIEGRLPGGAARPEWDERLDSLVSMADEGKWSEAAESMANLTSDLDAFESKRNETKEMLDFLQEDWLTLRKRLDSSGIGPGDNDRMEAEKAISDAEQALGGGELQNCLEALGAADTAIESLRRRT